MPAERIAIGDTATLRELDPRTVADVEVAVRDYFADIPALANVARCDPSIVTRSRTALSFEELWIRVIQV
jgi:hypothetical protein